MQHSFPEHQHPALLPVADRRPRSARPRRPAVALLPRLRGGAGSRGQRRLDGCGQVGIKANVSVHPSPLQKLHLLCSFCEYCIHLQRHEDAPLHQHPTRWTFSIRGAVRKWRKRQRGQRLHEQPSTLAALFALGNFEVRHRKPGYYGHTDLTLNV